MVFVQPLKATRTNGEETIPTLSDFLKIAAIHNKTVIFDINEPQTSAHPHHKGFITLITDVIRVSNIHEEKVILLYKSL